MKYFILLFFIITAQLTFGQEQRIVEKTINEQVAEGMKGYSKRIERNRKISWHNEFIQEFGFTDIRKIPADYIFRYCTYDSVIEVIIEDGNTRGFISNFIKVINEEREREVHIITKVLSDDVCNKIIGYVNTSDIKTLSSEEDIEDWKRSYHYAPRSTIEIMDTNDYVFKTYIAPNDQTAIEANTLIIFIERLKIVSNYNAIKRKFYKEKPYQCYQHWNASYNVCRMKTK